MLKNLIIALSIVSFATAGAAQASQASGQKSLNLKLNDELAPQREADPAILHEDKLAELNKAEPESGDADPGKFNVKPEFKIIDNNYDYNNHDKDEGEEVKLNLNYNF